MIILIIIGLIIWLALPFFFKGKLKKNNYKAMATICKIIGIVIMVWSMVEYIKVLL